MTQKPFARSVRLAGVLLATSVLLSGCFDKTAPQLIQSGKARMEKKDYRAAAIDFKNALQQDGASAEARFLLGKSLFETGNVQEAWIEFSKVKAAGYSNDELAPAMAMAMLVRGEADKLIAEYATVDLGAPKARAALKAALATAYGLKGKYAESRQAAEAALKDDANNTMAHLVIAQVLRVSGDKADTLAQVDRAVATNPESDVPWMAKAEHLLAFNAEPASVMAAYREAVRLAPDNVRAHVGIIQLLLQQRDFDGAQQQLAQLEKRQPKSWQGRYYATLMAYEQRDLKKAFESSQELLKIGPNNSRFLQLAGAIEYERGNYLQAIAHLGKALPDSSSPVTVRLLMARSQLRAGDASKALSYVQPLLEGDGRVPAEAYSVAADCYLQLGDGEAAKRMYAKALAMNPDDTRGRTVLALSSLNEGRTEQAMTELKSIAGSSKSDEAEVVMIMDHLRNKRLEEALAVIDALEKKQPGKPVAPYLRARVEDLRGQRSKARDLYEQSVTRQASYVPAVVALAAFDLDDNKPANAVARFEKLVAAAPNDVSARLGLVAARVRAGAQADDVRAQLEEVIKQFPDSVLPRLTLVGDLLDRKDAKSALQVANAAVARFPENAGLLQAQGLAELATGALNQAAQSFTKASALQPNAVEPLMYLAEVQLARKDMKATLAQLRKALAVKPDHLPAQGRLIALLARSGKMDEALSVAKGLQTQMPNSPNGWIFQGELEAMKGNRSGAVVAFKAAQAKGPSDETAIKLHSALLVASQAAEADKFAGDWLASRPDSATFNFYLGEQALGRQDYERAEQFYRKVIQLQPSNVIALNNVAWLLHRAGKPGALEAGEKALSLAPNAEAVLDTVAEIQAAAGKIDKALVLQQRALERNPNQPLLRLHLAQYLIKNGQKAEARTELEKLASMGAQFDRQDEVKKLLATL